MRDIGRIYMSVSEKRKIKTAKEIEVKPLSRAIEVLIEKLMTLTLKLKSQIESVSYMEVNDIPNPSAPLYMQTAVPDGQPSSSLPLQRASELKNKKEESSIDVDSFENDEYPDQATSSSSLPPQKCTP